MKKILLLATIMSVIMTGCSIVQAAEQKEPAKCTGMTTGYNFDKTEIELSEEELSTINSYYSEVNTDENVPVSLAFLGYYTLTFDDGSILFLDNNDDAFADYVNGDVHNIVHIQSEFKDFVKGLE